MFWLTIDTNHIIIITNIRIPIYYILGGVIDCSAHGVPSPVINWFLVRRNQMKITVNSIVNYNQSSDPLLEVLAHNRSLRFRPFAPSEYNSDIHSAEYQCQARSESGATLSRKVTVTSGKFGKKIIALENKRFILSFENQGNFPFFNPISFAVWQTRLG